MKLPHAGAAAACVLGLGLGLSPALPAARAAEPSFDCGKVEAGSMPGLVCSDDGLAALDRKMAAVYAAATAKASGSKLSELKAEQRGWIKGRDDCWKSADKRGCVEQAYVLRIAELQAAYALVPATGHAVYLCEGQAGKRVTATYFQTEPPTAIAGFGGQTGSDVPAARRQRREVPGAQRDAVGASRRGVDRLGVRQSRNALPREPLISVTTTGSRQPACPPGQA